jgi:hypothetical protein
LNSVYPCWYGRKGDPINDKAGIVWLTKQQGHTKKLLQKVLDGDAPDTGKFLKSLHAEVLNCGSHMQALTFLVEMTFKEIIDLNMLIKQQDRNGHHYDASCNPDCGYIGLCKETVTGLFDPWCGGGSLFEIELEREVKIPIKFIRSALPDGGDGYSVDDVYGMCGSEWKDTCFIIQAPKNFQIR